MSENRPCFTQKKTDLSGKICQALREGKRQEALGFGEDLAAVYQSQESAMRDPALKMREAL